MAPTSVHTLVIADDHVLTRDGLRGLVASMGGFDIVGEAENGLEAISIIKQTQPDLAILDLKMPYTNGAEAYLEIRRWSPRTKVVILTGLSSPALFRELRDSGIDGLFLKTGGVGPLKEALLGILEGSKIIAADIEMLISQADDMPALTRRELQILQGIARGETNAAIAGRLGISRKTVDSHRTSLMAKLDVHSTATLLARAIRDGLIDTGDTG